MISRTITLQGRNFTQPDTSTAWQREHAEVPLLPMADEFAGARKLRSWAACAAVAIVFWTAVFAAAFS